MIRRPPRSTPKPSSAASDVYKRQLRDNADLCIAADIYEPESSFIEVLRQDKCDNEWRFCSDTDHAGNGEVQNRMRSQNGEYAGLNGAPFSWYSKASSVTFACEKIGEAHADTSSTAVEIYGVGNATQNILGHSYVIEEMGIEFPFPCLLYTSPSPRDRTRSRMPSSA